MFYLIFESKTKRENVSEISLQTSKKTELESLAGPPHTQCDINKFTIGVYAA